MTAPTVEPKVTDKTLGDLVGEIVSHLPGSWAIKRDECNPSRVCAESETLGALGFILPYGTHDRLRVSWSGNDPTVTDVLGCEPHSIGNIGVGVVTGPQKMAAQVERRILRDAPAAIAANRHARDVMSARRARKARVVQTLAEAAEGLPIRYVSGPGVEGVERAQQRDERGEYAGEAALPRIANDLFERYAHFTVTERFQSTRTEHPDLSVKMTLESLTVVEAEAVMAALAGITRQ